MVFSTGIILERKWFVLDFLFVVDMNLVLICWFLMFAFFLGFVILHLPWPYSTALFIAAYPYSGPSIFQTKKLLGLTNTKPRNPKTRIIRWHQSNAVSFRLKTTKLSHSWEIYGHRLTITRNSEVITIIFFTRNSEVITIIFFISCSS